MKQLPEGFLWGGATADFQYEGGFNEGGRGLLSHDYETDGSLEHPRAHTLQRADGSIIRPRSSFFYADPVPQDAKPIFLDDQYYPSHQAVDFYHHYKEDIDSWQAWDLMYFVFLSAGVVFIQLEMN